MRQDEAHLARLACPAPLAQAGAPQDAAGAAVGALTVPLRPYWHHPSPVGRLRLAALGAAVAAHAGLLYGLAREPADDLAGGGGQLEAISVTIVNSTLLESRDVNLAQPPAPAAAAAVEADDGAAESAPAPQQEKQEIKATEEEKAQDQSLPTTAIVAVPVEAQEQHRKEASEAMAVGGAMARSDNVSAATQSAPAAASPGAVRDYARHVSQALAKTRPKGTGGYGTVKLKLVIAPGGGLTAVEVAKSSGNKRLDELALAAVQRATLPVPPLGMTVPQLTYEVPYHFR